MQFAAPHQAPGDVGRLQRCAFGRRMGREIAGDRNEDVPALVGIAPYAELPDSRLQHLIGVEARIFAQHRARERGDQRLGRMAEREMPCHQPCRESTCRCRSKASSNAARIVSASAGKSSSCSPLFTGNAGRRHIEIASKIERHRAVQHAANRGDMIVDVGRPDPRQHLVHRVGVGEDVVRRLPIGMFVGVAEARHPERRRVGEGSTEIGRSGAGADRLP